MRTMKNIISTAATLVGLSLLLTAQWSCVLPDHGLDEIGDLSLASELADNGTSGTECTPVRSDPS